MIYFLLNRFWINDNYSSIWNQIIRHLEIWGRTNLNEQIHYWKCFILEISCEMIWLFSKRFNHETHAKMKYRLRKMPLFKTTQWNWYDIKWRIDHVMVKYSIRNIKVKLNKISFRNANNGTLELCKCKVNWIEIFQISFKGR